MIKWQKRWDKKYPSPEEFAWAIGPRYRRSVILPPDTAIRSFANAGTCFRRQAEMVTAVHAWDSPIPLDIQREWQNNFYRADRRNLVEGRICAKIFNDAKAVRPQAWRSRSRPI